MATGRKTGGRQKGTPNANKQELVDLLNEHYPGYNPVVQMAGIAQDETVEMVHRVQCAKEIAGYIFPKLKSIESNISGNMRLVAVELTGVDDSDDDS
tara:strand:+ start:559 stop:849 length:291 start_codon:yes stop_codon:yes gene_type:complete